MVLTFEQFINESQNYEKKQEILKKIMLNVAESLNEKAFVELLIEQDFYSDFFSLNEESLIDKWKRKYDTAVEVMKEKGKSALTAAQEKIVKFGGNIANVIKTIVEKVSSFLKDAWNDARSAASSAVAKVKDELADKVESIKDKTKLDDEIKDFKNMAKGGVTWALNGFPKQLGKAEMQAVKVEESLEILLLESALELSEREDFLDLFEGEGGIPFISAIAHKIAEFPPFDALHAISAKVGEVAKNSLDRASIFFSEIAGTPAVTYVVLPALIGIAAEYMVKKSVAGLLAPIPGLGTIVAVISTIALGLAIVSVVEALIKKGDQKEAH